MVKKQRKNDFLDFMEDVVFFLWRSVACILLASAIIIGVYETPNILGWNDLTDNYTCVMGNFYVNGASRVDDAEKLNEFVEALPPAFVREFKNNWRVVIEDYFISTTGHASDIVLGGYTDWNSRTILVKAQTEYADTLDIFAHELGHCFDFEYGSVSFSTEFGDIYNLYKDSFSEQYESSPKGYSTSSTSELFAACFKEYLLCPEHLKTVAPKAYDYVDIFYDDIQSIKYMYIYDFGSIANTVARLAE